MQGHLSRLLCNLLTIQNNTLIISPSTQTAYYFILVIIKKCIFCAIDITN